MVGHRASRDPAGMRWILITIAWVALAGAADTPAIQGWAGVDLHVADGHWVSREVPCGPDESECTEEVLPVAIRGLLPSDRELVTRASVAAYPEYFTDVRGTPNIISRGLDSTWIIVFDLADGRRKVATVACAPTWDGSGYNGSSHCRLYPFPELRQRGPDPLPRH